MNEWKPVENPPPFWSENAFEGPKPYVLAIDAKGRMSVGYVRARYSTGELWWVFAKPIAQVTHWMPLPDPPGKIATPLYDVEDFIGA